MSGDLGHFTNNQDDVNFGNERRKHTQADRADQRSTDFGFAFLFFRLSGSERVTEEKLNDKMHLKVSGIR